MRVVVIGGGLAGIAAAIQLKTQGSEVVLVEAKRRLGGRVGSYWDAASNQWVDYCQHVAMGCCTQWQWFLEQLGQLDDWERQTTLHFVSPAGKKIPIRPLPLPAPLHLASLIASWPGLTLAERFAVARGLWRLMRLDSPSRSTSGKGAWRRMLALKWLQEIGQSPATIHKFWGTILVSALGESIDRVFLGDAHQVLMQGFAAHRHAYELLIPKYPLAVCIDEGAQKKLLSLQVDLQLQTPCKRLVFSDGKLAGVETQEGRMIQGDRFVLALPWQACSSLITASIHSNDQNEIQSELHQIESKLEWFDTSPITGVHMWWSHPWLREPHAILIDRLCQWVFPGPINRTEGSVSNDNVDQAGHYYQVVISASRSLPKGDSQGVLEEVVRELQEVFPEARKSQFLRGKVVTDPNAVFSVRSDLSESTTSDGSNNPRCSTSMLAHRNLWLAGDWTQTGWPATMEGAVRSGLLAANSILKRSELPAPELQLGLLARCLIAKSKS